MRSVLLAAALVLSLSSSVFAQVFTVTETVIPIQQRQGTYQSGSKVIDATVGPILRIELNISAADYVVPTNIVWVRLWRSPDEGATWIAHGGMRWTGGPYTNEAGEVNPMPWLQVGLDQIRGQLLRAEIDVPSRMRVGAVIHH